MVARQKEQKGQRCPILLSFCSNCKPVYKTRCQTYNQGNPHRPSISYTCHNTAVNTYYLNPSAGFVPRRRQQPGMPCGKTVQDARRLRADQWGPCDAYSCPASCPGRVHAPRHVSERSGTAKPRNIPRRYPNLRDAQTASRRDHRIPEGPDLLAHSTYGARRSPCDNRMIPGPDASTAPYPVSVMKHARWQ